MTLMAVEECGNKMVTNMVSLGVLCGYTNLVSLDSLRSAVSSVVRKDLVAVNLRALSVGYAAAQETIDGLPVKKKLRVRDYSLRR
jgi:Pyruvate/2-oxoacid:ferredoxin oxidoreductase gamma subunit